MNNLDSLLEALQYDADSDRLAVKQELQSIITELQTVISNVEEGRLYRRQIPVERVALLSTRYAALVVKQDVIQTIKFAKGEK